jgi:hypothetical protein
MTLRLHVLGKVNSRLRCVQEPQNDESGLSKTIMRKVDTSLKASKAVDIHNSLDECLSSG